MVIPDTRISLLQRLGDRGDSAAWGEFCEIYERVIFRIAVKYGLQDADAREVSQEVLLAVSRRIQNFEFDGRGRFRAWLATIARNATIDVLRKNRRTPASLAEAPNQSESTAQRYEPVAGCGDSQVFDLEALRQQFRWAAEQIQPLVSPKTWQAFWRTAVDGQTAESVADQMNMTVGSVYVARCRTLAKIKALIEPFREEL